MSSIFSQKITRKEFLKYLGVIVLTITGITGIITTINKGYPISKTHNNSQTFGTGPYGGVRRESL